MRWVMVVAATPATSAELTTLGTTSEVASFVEAVGDVHRKIASATSWVSPCDTIRCASVVDLLEQVQAYADEHGLIDRLDVFDHGNPGLMKLGAEDLFYWAGSNKWSDPWVGEESAFALSACLAPVAQVRLLGCRTAAGGAGRRLLCKLSEAFGSTRSIEGTIARLYDYYFDSSGAFSAPAERALLFSSTAALDREAPDSDARLDHLDEIVGA